MKRTKVLVIVGPTASGKSDLAVKLAKKLGGEIISADSRQVYKGLDIGTGKITKVEMRGVPHYLLDVADPRETFSAGEYKKLAEPILKNISDRDKLAIIVGGTGFYIDTLTGTASLPQVGPNKKLRERLDKKSVEELFKILEKKDPRRAGNIDPKNKVRLIRALEIIEALGKVPRPKNDKSAPYKFIYLGLNPTDIEERIKLRLQKRLVGIIKESKKLHSQGLSYKRMDELGLEYRYASLYLQGKLNKKEMGEKLNIEIRRYAKRQMTWFKRNKKIRWFKPEEYKQIEEYLKQT
jgi:tRNA dimethylallyltransferase